MIRFFGIQGLLVLFLTFAVGIGVNSITGNYWLLVSYTESFTIDEAEALIGKRVVDSCLSKTEKQRGFVVSTTNKIQRGTNYITVEYDEPIQGKFNLISLDKSQFGKCLKIVE